MQELQSISVVAPGFAGINTQDSSVTLPNSFALTATNCIIDKFGRLGARKGWLQKTTDGDTVLSGKTLEFVHEHTNFDDTSTYLSGGNNKIFKNGIGAALVDITPEDYVITDNLWDAATLNDTSLIVQQGHAPLVYDEEETTALQTLDDYTGASPSFGSSHPRQVLAAFGRYWVTDGRFVYWSTDIADSNFPSFSGGTAGFLNISSVLPRNVDTVTALAAHNDFLIIFCEKNIVVYRGAENILGADFGVEDVIPGVGCIARDSIQNTGGDILFLSAQGVRSFGRLVQEKSMPMRDLTVNVRDDLQTYVDQELNKDRIKSVYSEKEAFYLLSFPSSQTVFVLDTRKSLEDGSARVTLWEQYPIGAFLEDKAFKIYLGKPNGIGEYTGYTDNGSEYRMSYASNHIDFQDSTVTKIAKKINCVVFGGSSQVFFIKSGTDYEDFEFEYTLQIKPSGDTGQWGLSEWNTFEWVSGALVDKVFTPLNGSGKTIQIGFETIIKGDEFSVQRIDLFVKLGRKN
jgi:hypothetical protein